MWLVTTIALGAIAGAAAPAALAGVPLPPAGATAYRLEHACTPFTTTAGWQQVRITAIADIYVKQMPPKPILVPEPHRIYQKITIELQRRALGRWKSERRTQKTRLTGAGQVNNGRSSVIGEYGPTTADGATFRVKITVRVYTERDGLPDRLHWKYSVASGGFSCPVAVAGVGGF
jgi:hypothetical protein